MSILPADFVSSKSRRREQRRRRGVGSNELGPKRPRSHIPIMQLDLTDAEAEALTQELAGIINRARYPLSPEYAWWRRS